MNYKKEDFPVTGHTEGEAEFGPGVLALADNFPLFIGGDHVVTIEEWGWDGDENLEHESRANVRRFVAVWNACLNIPTEALERVKGWELVPACQVALKAEKGGE